MHHTEVVDADVCELRAASHFPDRPHTMGSCLQSFVDLDVSSVGTLDASQFQSESFGIRSTACSNQHMTASYDLLRPILLNHDPHGLTRLSRNSLDLCIQMNVNALVLKQVSKSVAYVLIFFPHQTLVAIDHRYLA